MVFLLTSKLLSYTLQPEQCAYADYYVMVMYQVADFSCETAFKMATSTIFTLILFSIGVSVKSLPDHHIIHSKLELGTFRRISDEVVKKTEERVDLIEANQYLMPKKSLVSPNVFD